MAIEPYTESLTLREMKCTIGENPFGYVFPQGDCEAVDKIESLLKKMGGKPKECNLSDFLVAGSGKAKPEYVITFNDDTSTIIVVECKKSVKFHKSENCSKPKDYAVDGVLFYAKHLKEEYNVVAIRLYAVDKNNKRAKLSDYAHTRVATKFPHIAEKFFNSKGMQMEFIKLNGSIELGPIVGLSESIVDIVETGTTLRENNLEEIAFIMDATARLICNRVSFKLKFDRIHQLTEDLRKILEMAK